MCYGGELVATRLKGNIQIILITALLSLVVSGTGFWMLFGREVMTREEVATAIQTTAPYTADKKQIYSFIERQTRILERLEAQSRYTEGALAGITAQTEGISSRLSRVESRVFQ